MLLYSILNIPDFPQESPAAIHLHIFLEKLESIALVGQVVIVLLDFGFQGLTNLLQYFRGDFPVFLLDHRFICVDPANLTGIPRARKAAGVHGDPAVIVQVKRKNHHAIHLFYQRKQFAGGEGRKAIIQKPVRDFIFQRGRIAGGHIPIVF